MFRTHSSKSASLWISKRCVAVRSQGKEPSSQGPEVCLRRCPQLSPGEQIQAFGLSNPRTGSSWCRPWGLGVAERCDHHSSQQVAWWDVGGLVSLRPRSTNTLNCITNNTHFHTHNTDSFTHSHIQSHAYTYSRAFTHILTHSTLTCSHSQAQPSHLLSDAGLLA